MPDMPLVSVIVPVYNVSRYLDQCLESLVLQTLPHIELICVDDGSTDGSGALLDQWAARDARISVIHKQNGGYGSAVNCGLDRAKGTYIGIVEPDDHTDPTMYEKLWREAEANGQPDVVKAAYWDVVNPDTADERQLPAPYFRHVSYVNKPFCLEQDASFLFHHPSIWTAIYRRSFLQENHIRMHEIAGAGWADNPWLMDTLLRAKTIVYVDECLYFYRDFSAGAAQVVKDPTILSDRWVEMDDIVRSLGITAPRILEGHYNRACWHVKALIEGFDQNNPAVRSCIKKIVRRVDYCFVAESPRINEGMKGALHSQVGLMPKVRKRLRELVGIRRHIG